MSVSFPKGTQTPSEVLEMYRRNSDEEMLRQAALFAALSPKEQRELMFYMCMHVTRGLFEVMHRLASEKRLTMQQMGPRNAPTTPTQQ